MSWKMPNHFAKHLRKNSTDAEKRLWYFLQNRELKGHKFRRQHEINGYIVYFVCVERKLVVELDGGQHQERAEADALRTRFLESKGYRVVRFWNDEVLSNTHGVLEVILKAIEDRPSPLPSPRSGARE
jgi:very-short-patch-repair endonuclease